MSLEYEGSTIETDENGYLVSLDDWSEGVADKLALDEDIEMNDQFFKQLEIPTPTTNLEVGSGSHAEQTGAIMIKFEKCPK